MLVYRSDEEPIDVRPAWDAIVRRVDRLPPRADHDEITAVLIDLGELEAAIADRLFAERDGRHPVADALRGASLAAATLFLASWKARPRMAAAHEVLRQRLAALPSAQLPADAAVRVSEGYAYYALHPETYAAAAARFVDAAGPCTVVAVGIRSIGTSLSAVVGAEVAARGIPVHLVSVRPRGHPFDRELRLADDLVALIRSLAGRAHFAIVDEGPGLSGSSFASTARALMREGAPADRIAMFPSWLADPVRFRSGRAGATWQALQKWCVPAKDAGVGIDAVCSADDAEDWSAGAWRQTRYRDPSEWPAVHPQHERIKRKLVARREIVRFAGLGRYGAEKYSRGAMLADAGFVPAPLSLVGGYLRERCVPGLPCVDADREVLDFLGRYAAFRARCCLAPRGTPLETLHEMIEINCREADDALCVPRLASFDPAIADAHPAVVDGRLLRHELIAGERPLKADALDHAEDHFFPGRLDVAWDLAAVETEFGLDAAASDTLIATFVKHSGDVSVRRRLPFYRLAYAAFQLGYAAMAAESLGQHPDGRRFEARRAVFLERVRGLTAR